MSVLSRVKRGAKANFNMLRMHDVSNGFPEIKPIDDALLS